MHGNADYVKMLNTELLSLGANFLFYPEYSCHLFPPIPFSIDPLFLQVDPLWNFLNIGNSWKLTPAGNAEFLQADPLKLAQLPAS